MTTDEFNRLPLLLRRKTLLELGLTRRGITAMVRAGMLHPVRPAGTYARFRREEVRRVVEAVS